MSINKKTRKYKKQKYLIKTKTFNKNKTKSIIQNGGVNKVDEYIKSKNPEFLIKLQTCKFFNEMYVKTINEYDKELINNTRVNTYKNHYTQKRFKINSIQEWFLRKDITAEEINKWWLDKVKQYGEINMNWIVYDEFRNFVINNLSELIHFILLSFESDKVDNSSELKKFKKKLKLIENVFNSIEFIEYLKKIDLFYTQKTYRELIDICISYMQFYNIHINKECMSEYEKINTIGNFIYLPMTPFISEIKFINYFAAPIYPFICSTTLSHITLKHPCMQLWHDLNIHAPLFTYNIINTTIPIYNFYNYNKIFLNLLNNKIISDVDFKTNIKILLYLIIHEPVNLFNKYIKLNKLDLDKDLKRPNSLQYRKYGLKTIINFYNNTIEKILLAEIGIDKDYDLTKLFNPIEKLYNAFKLLYDIALEASAEEDLYY